MWAMRSGDTGLMSTVAAQILSQCDPTSISSIMALENLDKMALSTPPLIFLYEYHKFRKHFECGKRQEAAELLVCYFLYRSSFAFISSKNFIVMHL